VLLQRIAADKVAVTLVAWPVGGIGSTFVLFQGLVVWERPFTAIAIRHGMVVVRSEGG
jgi:hypothetical protein